MLLALGVAARGQEPAVPRPAPSGEFASVAEAPEPTTEAPFAPTAWTFAAPVHDAPDGLVTVAPRVEMSVLATIADSLFGDVYAEDRWRPLSLGTFFTEGWLEPWASAPAGRDGLTPRHGWLGTFDGVFYRLWFTRFGYSHNLNAPYGGNRYTGDYSIFLPFSRRFEILLEVPFVVSNGTTSPKHGYTSQFGDLLVAPRFLLSESAATTQLFALAIRTPTGTTATNNGVMALTPRYEFWTNPGGPWVVRGSGGFYVPLNKDQAPGQQTSFQGGLAVGRYFTPHDVPFSDLVFYCESNFNVPLDGGARRSTLVTIGPGTRFHIANNYFFLMDLDVPVTGNRPSEYTLLVSLLKVF